MIRANDIQEKLLHLIGWQQNQNTNDFSVADYMTTSESGLYFQQCHPLMTLQNINSISPDFKNEIYQNFSEFKPYEKGNVILYNEILYKAKLASLGVVPTSEIGDEYWEKTNPFSEWLENKTKASIIKAILRYCNDKISKGTYKTICENKTLFDGTGRIIDTIENKHKLVGFEIVPIRAKGVTTKINKIGLQFTQQGEYTIYIMHSSMNTPVKILKFNKIRKSSIEWFTVNDLYLPYQSDDNDAGGSWFICYMQDELPENSMAITKEYDWSKGPCSSCSKSEFNAWSVWSRYLEVHPYSVQEDSYVAVTFNEDFNDDFSKNPLEMWDLSKNLYDYNTNYGLNLDISIQCDITDFIIEQKNLFQDVIFKQVTIDMLREMAFNANVRTNRNSLNASKLDILYELDGDSSSLKKSGLNYQLDNAFKAIELSTEGINRVCLPCKNNGIKYRSI